MLRARLRERQQNPTSEEGVWRQHLLRRAEQALEDLAETGGSSVSFVRHARTASAAELADALAERARARGFVTAAVDVSVDHALDTFDELVRGVLRTATHRANEAAARRKAGLGGLLDAFVSSQLRDPIGELERVLDG